MVNLHNLHYQFFGTSHHHLSPGLLQELSDLPLPLYTQESICHTTAKFFLLILGRIVSFLCSKQSKVFHLILSKNQTLTMGYTIHDGSSSPNYLSDLCPDSPSFAYHSRDLPHVLQVYSLCIFSYLLFPYFTWLPHFFQIFAPKSSPQ